MQAACLGVDDAEVQQDNPGKQTVHLGHDPPPPQTVHLGHAPSLDSSPGPRPPPLDGSPGPRPSPLDGSPGPRPPAPGRFTWATPPRPWTVHLGHAPPPLDGSPGPCPPAPGRFTWAMPPPAGGEDEQHLHRLAVCTDGSCHSSTHSSKLRYTLADILPNVQVKRLQERSPVRESH
ncbi:unnamed protein product [Gadus morhua 'NCC']